MLDRATQLPWNVDQKEARDEDICVDVPGKEEEVQPFPETQENKQDRRNFKIFQKDVIEMGPSQGCPGCKAALGEGRNRIHTDECRKRFEDMLAERGDPRINMMMHRMERMMRQRLEEAEHEEARRTDAPQQTKTIWRMKTSSFRKNQVTQTQR